MGFTGIFTGVAQINFTETRQIANFITDILTRRR